MDRYRNEGSSDILLPWDKEYVPINGDVHRDYLLNSRIRIIIPFIADVVLCQMFSLLEYLVQNLERHYS